MRNSHRLRVGVALATLLAPLALIACGNEEDADSSGGGSSLSIVEPIKDAKVTLPFTVKVKSAEPLGPTDTGKHHVHLWLDDDSENYLVVESDTATVEAGMKATLSGQPLGLAPGKHIIHVSLRNANHSPAGSETEIPVELATGTGPAPSPTQSSSEPEYGNGY
ncbi:hypothetical protein GCM10009789_37670 [Kribbella sancticallisti]|uniref:DUF4399 domain-containing protein n=1 Tax=Kribbella sancticallisti TaxID=460087 RepID=A0ABP4PN39_9ACTN